MFDPRSVNSTFVRADPRLAPDQDHKRDAYHRLRRATDQAMEARPPIPYVTRPSNSADLPFILDSWCSSYRHAAGADKIPADIYKVEQRARISRILKSARVTMLAPEASPDRPSGWMCFQPPGSQRRYPILHYLLIHPNLQMRGLAAKLFRQVSETRIKADDPIWASHWTIPMKKIIPKWNLIFNPYLLELL